MDLKFNKTVGKSESTIGENDQAIDTTASTEEEKEEQEKALLEINNFNDQGGDTSTGESDEDEEESEDDEEESEDDSEDEEEESEEESTDEESEEESDEEESEESDEEGSDNDQEESEEEHQETDDSEGIDWSDPVKQKQTFDKFFKDNLDIIPKSAREHYQKFYETGNDAFLHLDNHLHKLVKSLEMINLNVPLPKRLEAAAKLAFSDKAKKLAQKKGEVIAEVRSQKVNKSASPVIKGDDSKSNKKTHSKEQLEMAKRMGVKI